MKWRKNNFYKYVIVFLFGALVNYILLQIEFFEIKKELDIPNLLISSITILVGLLIATSLQKKVNKNQNQHSYLITKFDSLWLSFNEISEILENTTKIEISTIQKLIKKVLYPASALIKVFTSFGLSKTNISKLENELDQFESYITDLPATDNIIDISDNKNEVIKKMKSIDIIFPIILNEIQEL